MTKTNQHADPLPRLAGVLLHVSSLPSQHHVGDMGEQAFKFVDMLHKTHLRVWQTLPINMPHADNSPYQCLSAHAGNPDFISLEALIEEGLLCANDVVGATSKTIMMARAYQNFVAGKESNIRKKNQQLSYQDYVDFCAAEAHWLPDFALFLSLRNQFNHAGWFDWPIEYKNRDAKALQFATETLHEEIAVIQFTQYVFFSQWLTLKRYANSKSVQLFGDIPIFVAYDSAEVWATPHLFKLDDEKKMTVVAGVPPDYFSADGQRWGNPHYNWQAMEATGFQWWVNRMKTQSLLFDMVRIDHFRGLEAAWEIPAQEPTAINGVWAEAPGFALLAAIKKALPEVMLIAEDLGIITEKVDALRTAYAMPGMKILQFAFSGQDDNPYLPQNITEHSVMYTGTHDNDTTLGWYSSLDAHQQGIVIRYLQSVYGDDHQINMPQDLIQLALSSIAYLAIIPMQDILALDSTHRMNTPGTTTGNWQWRFDWSQLQADHLQFLAQTVQQTQRH